MEYIDGGVCAPKGFKASGIHCGIRKNKSKKDLALIYSDVLCQAAAVYTQNKVKGAPIYVTQKNLKNGTAQAVICNSGNANTCNADGLEKAQIMCDELAKKLNIKSGDVIVASTGVIGMPFDVDVIVNGMDLLISKLSYEGGSSFEEGIMTTDTVLKEAAISFETGGKVVKIGACAKGSGMICPNMATMLCFVTTDACIDNKLLSKILKETADETFNMVIVDGDTSTNDMLSIMANGKSGVCITEANCGIFKEALFDVLKKLSKMIAKDGEGATKLLECQVINAPDEISAKLCVRSVINSPLVKSAFFGADANWGRILCALGYSQADIDVNKVDISFISSKGEILLCKNGMGVDFSEEKAKEILKEKEILILINLNQGNKSATGWGCDLTYDYVRINGDYRT